MESVYTIAIPMRCNRVFSATLIGVDKMVSEIRATLTTFPFSVIPRRAVGIPNKSWLFNHIVS